MIESNMICNNTITAAYKGHSFSNMTQKMTKKTQNKKVGL